MKRVLRPAAAILLTFAAPASALAEGWKPAGWDKPMHGVTVDLPGEWTSETSQEASIEVIEATCRTAECARTQETCRFVITDEPIPEGLMPGAWLVSLATGPRQTRDEVLGDSHEGATITRGPAVSWIGTQSWYVTETMAAYGWKSLFQATTVIDGRFIKVQCRTCDRGEQRFAFADRILRTVAVRP